MDSEASSSSAAAAVSKKPKTNNTKRRAEKNMGSSSTQDKTNHVLGSSPPPQATQGGTAASGDESEGSSPHRTSRPKAKNKTPRRRKASASPIMIENIIEGFAMASFKSEEDIENFAQQELDEHRIMTQGFMATLPSRPPTPLSLPTLECPNAMVTDTQLPTQLPTPDQTHTDMELDIAATLIATAAATVAVAITATCTVTTATNPLAMANPEGALAPPVMCKTPSKTDKLKKEGSKKAKKSLEKTPSSESIGVSNHSSSKENKVQSARSNPSKGATLKSSKCAQDGSQPLVNSPKPECLLGGADFNVKEEFRSETKAHSHTNNNNNHKLKALDTTKDTKDSISKKDSFTNKDNKTNIIRKSEIFSPNHTKPSRLLIPPCLITADAKTKDPIDVNRVLVKTHQLIVEEPLRQNGQSVSSLSVSSVASDRSSSRDRLSDASSTGRGYMCDSESEIESSSKASDAGSESLFTTNPAKNREHCLVPPALHNGILHPVIPNAVNPLNSSNILHHVVPASVKVPTATTANVTKVTATTTAANISTVTATTVATTTTSSATVLTSSKPHASSSSSSHISSSSPASSSHPVRAHTPIHREQPRPIPGLSGTRPEERDPRDHWDHRDHITPRRPYSRGPSWQSPSGAPASQLPHSSPHISPAPVVSLSLPGIHHTPGSSLHHQAPPHHTPPLHHGLPPHSMFAPPIAPPAALTSSALQVPNPLGVDLLSSPLGPNHDLIGRSPQELSHRFLAERLNLPGSNLPSQFLSSFHQHHHQHQHMHHYGPYGAGAGLLHPGVPGGPQLLDKFAKLESPLYRPGLPGLPGPLGLTSMLPPPGHGLPSALGSNLGAFQPKSGTPSGLHPSPLLLPLQPRDGAKQPPGVNPVKKSGKWCAAHVRIAWQIQLHQQKQVEPQHTPDGAKPSDLLRPPSHLLAGSGLHRPELGPALLGPNAHSRSPFDTAHPALGGNLFGPAHLGASPFPRPSPYPGLTSLNSGAFGGLANISGSLYGREMPAIPGLTSPHEWNRLHRTPPSFPTPPAWPPRSETEREREKERERERERDLEREREKDARERERERDKERERSASREPNHHHHHHDMHREREGSQSKDLNHRERDRDRDTRDKEHDLMMKRSPSRDPDRRSYDDRKHERSVDRLDRLERSRSRSPLRNGPESLIKRESPYTHGSPLVRDPIKVKEERKEDVMMLDDRRSVDHRPDGLHKQDGRNNILPPPHSLSTLYPPNSILDRRPLPVSPYDRPGPHLWHPFDRSPIDHRFEMVRDMEREREQLRRLSHPLSLPVSAPSALSLLEADKLREQQEMLLRDHAAIRDRERLMQIEKEQRERILASFTATHHEMERAKIQPALRPADAYHPAFGGPIPNSMYHPSGASRPPSNSSYHHPSGASRPPSSPVIINHNSNSSSSKSNSPIVVGAPPPLIPSNPSHNHTGSPAPNAKVRPPTPITNNLNIDSNKDKLKVNSNGLDTDSQAR